MPSKIPYCDRPEEWKVERRRRATSYYAKNADRYKNRIAKRHIRAVKIGISVEEIEDRKRQQNNRCAVCGGEAEDGKRNKTLCADHDHATGKFRGLLCFRCNLGLGYFKDDPERLVAAARYLQRNGKGDLT